jgi:Nuclease-related domain
VANDVETRPATFAAAHASTHARRSLALVSLFVGVGALPLVLSQAFEVPLVASAVIVTLMVALYHAADGESALMERWLKGSTAEVAVGETLEALRWERYIVMHDIPQRGEGNIDHVVSGPNGVYLVETKFARYLPVHLRKAKRQAARLHDELGVWVTPVVCLATRHTRSYRRDGVWVVSRDELADWIRAQANEPVDFDRLARFAESL